MINQRHSSGSLLKTPRYSPQHSEKFSVYTGQPLQHEREGWGNRLVKLIGYDRLLSSMDSLAPISNLDKSNEQRTHDRFIPRRREAVINYELEGEEQNGDEGDPQSVSVRQIYSESVLGREGVAGGELGPFRNRNILRFQGRDRERGSHEWEHPLSLLGAQQQPRVRKISKIPCKVLDAPALQDDFYLNLIDWSSSNQLAVGLGNCIYLWNADNSKVTRLCELHNDLVTSVAWNLNGTLLSIGCNRGEVLVWDVAQGKESRKLGGHDVRVGAMAWSSSLLATGSRDKAVLLRDVRSRRDYHYRLGEHSQEICGLKWSLDEQYLASGGNDNKVGVWSSGGQLVNKFTDHRAAVKALAWSPQQHGLLATGGGTADRMLKMRNIFTGKIVCEKDTGSQICNLAFSRQLHEVVSTHGYSQNEINVWSYPKMKKVATLIGHTHRVLYLASSPDGSTIVTGAGDQTLRFWNVFPPNRDSSEYQPKPALISQGLLLR